MGACTDLPHRGLETGTATSIGPLPRTMIALGPLKGLGRSMDRVLANFSGSTAAVGGSTSARATAVRALSEAISRRRETDLRRGDGAGAGGRVLHICARITLQWGPCAGALQDP